MWNSVKELYPDKEGFYLCSTGTHRPFICFFRVFKNIKNFITGDGSHAIINNVKYWMELPNNPEKTIDKSENQKDKSYHLSDINLKKHITSNEIMFLFKVLSDSIQLGENKCFDYQLSTRQSMQTNLMRKIKKS